MPSGQFITNKTQVLSEIINSILPTCDNAYFLVGYFYFSGFKELYTTLRETNLRILVGLEVERNIVNGIKEIDNLNLRNKSRAQIREEYYQGLVDVFNNTDFFDSEEQLEAFKLFCDKIIDGSLEIRKTLDPNHAKMYLFENRPEHTQCGTFPGTLITGSSNLSIAGLRNRLELNAILRGQNDYEEGRQLFDELWEDAIAVADAEHVPDFTEKVIKHIWFEKLYRPYLMYLRVLNEYFSTPSETNLLTPSDITGGVFTDLQYQLDAVKMALKAIENHSGVIIADVVGLGKSIIGSTVAKNLGLRTIIVCPPHLKQQWEEYKDEFDEEDTVEKTINPDNSIFSARLEIDYLNKNYKFNFPESDDYETLAGYIIHYHESIPQIGEEIAIGTKNSGNENVLSFLGNHLELLNI